MSARRKYTAKDFHPGYCLSECYDDKSYPDAQFCRGGKIKRRFPKNLPRYAPGWCPKRTGLRVNIPHKRRQLDGWHLFKLREGFRREWHPSKEASFFLGRISISPLALDLMTISEITKALVKHSQKSWPDTGECITEFIDSRGLKFKFLTKQSDYDDSATEITESTEKDYSLLFIVR